MTEGLQSILTLLLTLEHFSLVIVAFSSWIYVPDVLRKALHSKAWCGSLHLKSWYLGNSSWRTRNSGHPWIHSDFEVCLVYKRPCQRNNKKPQTNTWVLDEAITSQFSVERWSDMRRPLLFAKWSTNPQGRHLIFFVVCANLWDLPLLFLNPLCGQLCYLVPVSIHHSSERVDLMGWGALLCHLPAWLWGSQPSVTPQFAGLLNTDSNPSPRAAGHQRFHQATLSARYIS